MPILNKKLTGEEYDALRDSLRDRLAILHVESEKLVREMEAAAGGAVPTAQNTPAELRQQWTKNQAAIGVQVELRAKIESE